MKKLLVVLVSVLGVSMLLGFIIIFEGNVGKLSIWWKGITRNSDWIYYSDYRERRVDSDTLRFREANSIVFIDKHLFWKGKGAIAKPKLTVENDLLGITLKSGGSGYSEQVAAKVTGAMAHEFELDPVLVVKGKVMNVGIKESSAWNFVPLAFCGDEKFAFTGTAEEKYPSGQIIEESKYLSGVKHGKVRKYNEKGIPLHDKDYVKGQKHGTHIYWYPEPLDPDDYKPSKGKDSEVLPTLWLKLRKDAKEKFGAGFGGQVANKWVVEKYKLKGGKFPVRMLEHWKNNLRHGLFEGYDKDFDQTFESEYDEGQRIMHKSLGKNK
jgi:hypothetical protein